MSSFASSPMPIPAPPTNLLAELDASAWMNLVRYAIALNTVASNAFLLVLFARFKSLRGAQCNLLIALNACVELVIGFGMAARGTFQLFALASHMDQFSHPLCVWVGSPLTGGFASNQVPVMALAADRLMAVARPFKYGKRINRPFLLLTLCLTVAIFCGAVWLSLFRVDTQSMSSQCSMGANAGPLFSTVWSVYAQISTLLVFSLYLSLLALFCRQMRAHTGSKTAWAVDNAEVHKRTQNRLTTSIALILLVYSLCWALPTGVWFVLNLLDPTNRTRINYVTFAQGFLTPFGAGINLYIYLAKHAEIRDCACTMVPVLKRLLRVEDISPTATKCSFGQQQQPNGTVPVSAAGVVVVAQVGDAVPRRNPSITPWEAQTQ